MLEFSLCLSSLKNSTQVIPCMEDVANRATMRNPDGATEIHEFCPIQREREGRTSELELLLSLSRQLQSLGGIPDRPTRQSQGQCSAAAKFAQKPFYPRPPCRAMNVQLSPDKTADFGRSEYTDRPGSEREG